MKNIYLVGLILLVVIILLSMNINEGYRSVGSILKPVNFENVQEAKKRQMSSYRNEQLQEGFANDGYHGSQNPVFPYTTQYLKSSLSGGKQVLEKAIWDYPSRYGDPYRYPNVILPASVMGCGGRRGACMGGSQIPIPNTLPPVNISERNIAPVNLTVRGFDEGIQQVGTIQKVFGGENWIYPLFGRRKYRNDNKWEYFVKFGQYGVILPVLPLRNYEELNTNDEVYIQGQKGKYRVTMYDEDIPQYLPFS